MDRRLDRRMDRQTAADRFTQEGLGRQPRSPKGSLAGGAGRPKGELPFLAAALQDLLLPSTESGPPGFFWGTLLHLGQLWTLKLWTLGTSASTFIVTPKLLFGYVRAEPSRVKAQNWPPPPIHRWGNREVVTCRAASLGFFSHAKTPLRCFSNP